MLVEIEQILITGHEVVRGAFNCALEVAIICRVVGDDVQRHLAWRHDPEGAEFTRISADLVLRGTILITNRCVCALDQL